MQTVERLAFPDSTECFELICSTVSGFPFFSIKSIPSWIGIDATSDIFIIKKARYSHFVLIRLKPLVFLSIRASLLLKMNLFLVLSNIEK